jgi:GntR family transcriptional regulator/MocR family aminotransferase
VILAGTASKVLAPALRLGWLVAPPALVAPPHAAALVHDHGGPTIDQVALALLMESGALDRHVRAGRTRYRARRAALLAALAEHLPQCPVGGLREAAAVLAAALSSSGATRAPAAAGPRRGPGSRSPGTSTRPRR